MKKDHTALNNSKELAKVLAYKRGIVSGAQTQMMCMILCLWDWDEGDLKNLASANGGFNKEFIKELLERNTDLMQSYNEGQEFDCSRWKKLIKEEIGIDIELYLDGMR